MLQNIRENLTGRMALIILAVIALSFVFVGGASFTQIGQSYAAKVDGTNIGIAAFENTYREQLQQNPQFAALPDDLRLTLRRSILEQLVQQQVIDNYLDEEGYRVTPTELTDYIMGDPTFQVDGVFNQEKYEQEVLLRANSVAEFERGVMRQMRRFQLQRAIRGSSIVSPAAYRRFLNLAFEQRIVTTANLTAESVAEEVSVTDEMIAAYYDDNPMMFQLPETADIAYVEVARDELARDVTITEEDLQEYYEYNKDRYQQDEQRQARHILILFDDDEAGAEAIADEMLTRIRAGEPFEALAEQYSADSLTASQGGDFGAMTEAQYPEAIGSAVFGMQEGEIAGPIRSDFGFHVVRLDEILESGPLPYAQVRSSLLIEMQEEQADGLFLEMQRNLSDARFDALDMASLADAAGLEVKTAEGFSRNGGEPFGTNEEVINAVFAPSILAGEDLTDVIEVDADRTVVISVSAHHPAVRQSLEDVSERIAATLTQNQSEAIMVARAQAMLAAIEGGEDFATAAIAASATVNAPIGMRREDAQADQFLQAAVFASPKPASEKVSAGLTRNGTGGYTVYKVEAVMPGRPEAIPVAERDSGKLQLTDTYGIGDFVAFVQELRANADIVVNEDALAATDLFQ